MDFVEQGLSGVISGAQKLGALGSAAVWAFFTLILIGYIVWTQKLQRQASQSAWETRMEEAKADGLMASALSKMADEIKELRHRLGGGSNV